MKIFVIFVAVLLSVQAATVPQDVTHKVTVPLPGNVLAVAKDVEVEVPAVVAEVPKNHKHKHHMIQRLVEEQTENVESKAEVTTGNPMITVDTSEVLGVESTSSEGSASGSEQTTVLPLVVPDIPVQVPQVPQQLHQVPHQVPQVPQQVPQIPQQAIIAEIKEGPTLVHYMAVEGQAMLAEINAEQVVSTMVPLLVDMVTHGINDNKDTTLITNSEEISPQTTDIVPEPEDITTDVTTAAIPEMTLDPLVAMENKEVVNVSEVSIVTPSKPEKEEVNEDKDGTKDSKEKHSKEDVSKEVNKDKDNLKEKHSKEDASEEINEDKDNSKDSKEKHSHEDATHESSSSSEVSHEEKQPQLHNHNVKDITVPSVSAIPPITEDISIPPLDPSTSADEVKPTLVSVPLQTDTIVIRRRRAIPFIDPTVVISPTGPPKLATNPKVIAEILAKSKNLQKRYKKSIEVENTPVPTTDVPLIKKIENNEDLPATIDSCDLLCTKFEFEPICGSNGLCLHEFSNQCILDTYNCKHPKNKFLATKDDRCQMHWLDFCSEKEMY